MNDKCLISVNGTIFKSSPICLFKLKVSGNSNKLNLSYFIIFHFYYYYLKFFQRNYLVLAFVSETITSL